MGSGGIGHPLTKWIWGGAWWKNVAFDLAQMEIG
jgi:hypothetical protein